MKLCFAIRPASVRPLLHLVMGSPGVLNLSIHGMREGKWQPDRTGHVFGTRGSAVLSSKTLTRRQAVKQICDRLLSGSDGNFCYNTDSRDTIAASSTVASTTKKLANVLV